MAVYIHWPFCAAKCPYCDFNSHVSAQIDQAAWGAAYLGEIDRYARELPGRRITSVFFGGGTPSLMAPALVASVLERIGARWALAEDLEVTLEANPSSAEADRFQGYRTAGVNRVSLGVQAVNDADLVRLGRLHDASEALAAIEMARGLFARVSFDLIYARQDQSLPDWRRELARALDLGPDHLSLYQLTIEDGTAFAKRQAAGGLRGLPDEDLAADLYEITQDMCEAAGLPAYEVSNHARVGDESRHNLTYWRSGDWLGIGPGAHGRLTIGATRYATESASDPAAWLAHPGEVERVALPLVERGEEHLLMGLRLREGIDLRQFQQVYWEIKSSVIKDLQESSLISTRDGRMRVSRKGRMVLNAILRELVTAQTQ